MLIATAACTSALVDIAMAQEEPTAPELQREHSYPAPPDGAPQPPQEAPSSLDRERAQPPAPQLPLALQELPLPEDELTETPSEVEAASAESTPPGIGNDEVLEMANAQFSDGTILAVIGANPTRFDVSPRTLVALKSAGVSERVIEAMLAAETAKRQIAVTAMEAASDGETEAGAAASQLPTEEFTKLSEMIERLAAQQEAAAVARREPDPPLRADPSPRAWIVGPADKTALAPTIAQVAFTDQGRGRRLETLQGLAGKALAFVNPGVSGIATTLGSLFVSEEKRTAVWALASTSASRELGADIVFEIEFARIPGVDPDKYQPAIVQLVPTNDNYRLVAAAKTEGANTGAMPSEPIVEELVATKLTRIARGHYRAVPASALGAGEYALVLRPIAQTERRRRRNSEASLGELLGGGTSQILYLTWDFSVAAAPAVTAPQAMVAPRSSN